MTHIPTMESLISCPHGGLRDYCSHCGDPVSSRARTSSPTPLSAAQAAQPDSVHLSTCPGHRGFLVACACSSAIAAQSSGACYQCASSPCSCGNKLPEDLNELIGEDFLVNDFASFGEDCLLCGSPNGPICENCCKPAAGEDHLLEIYTALRKGLLKDANKWWATHSIIVITLKCSEKMNLLRAALAGRNSTIANVLWPEIQGRLTEMSTEDKINLLRAALAGRNSIIANVLWPQVQAEPIAMTTKDKINLLRASLSMQRKNTVTDTLWEQVQGEFAMISMEDKVDLLRAALAGHNRTIANALWPQVQGHLTAMLTKDKVDPLPAALLRAALAGRNSTIANALWPKVQEELTGMSTKDKINLLRASLPIQRKNTVTDTLWKQVQAELTTISMKDKVDLLRAALAGYNSTIANVLWPQVQAEPIAMTTKDKINLLRASLSMQRKNTVTDTLWQQVRGEFAIMPMEDKMDLLRAALAGRNSTIVNGLWPQVQRQLGQMLMEDKINLLRAALAGRATHIIKYLSATSVANYFMGQQNFNVDGSSMKMTDEELTKSFEALRAADDHGNASWLNEYLSLLPENRKNLLGDFIKRYQSLGKKAKSWEQHKYCFCKAAGIEISSLNT